MFKSTLHQVFPNDPMAPHSIFENVWKKKKKLIVIARTPA